MSDECTCGEHGPGQTEWTGLFFMAIGVSDEVIAESTGLTPEELAELREVLAEFKAAAGAPA